MSMKVSSIANAYEVYQTRVVRGADRLSRAQEKRDMAVLSSHAKDYQMAAKAVRNAPEIRADKIREIQKRIESGSYNVSSSDVAGKMLGII
ncbi:MAG: flagellar biosynthesis anti-sigma factor FlgM [Clostridiales bacterium]|jgi:negative regulator of flagellin synthesis FlgM|nr:flagellar biosynthesis anti-sigma factor FlgM [Clostridiales bacterium]